MHRQQMRDFSPRGLLCSLNWSAPVSPLHSTSASSTPATVTCPSAAIWQRDAITLAETSLSVPLQRCTTSSPSALYLLIVGHWINLCMPPAKVFLFLLKLPFWWWLKPEAWCSTPSCFLHVDSDRFNHNIYFLLINFLFFSVGPALYLSQQHV